MKRYRLVIFRVFILTALVLAFFYRTLISQSLPIPADALVGLYHPWRDAFSSAYPRGVPYKNFLITDPVRQMIPWRKTVIDAITQGRYPGWNPYTQAGTPLSSNIQAAAFYPFNMVFLLLPFPASWTTLIILQPVLSVLFSYFFLRNLGVRKLSAAVGSFTWAFSGFSIAWLTWGTIVHAALWLPLALLAVDRLRHNIPSGTAGILWTSVLAVSLSMSFLAGHAQTTLYVYMLVTAYILRSIFSMERSQIRSYSIKTTIAACGTVLMTAPQWLSFVPAYLSSPRASDTALWTQSGWFVPWHHLIQFLAPDYFGNPATLNYWGVWNYGEFLGYAGIVAITLAATAVLSQGKRTGFWIWALAISLVFMTSNVVSRAIYIHRFPVISVLQPTRLIMIADFCLAVLAAYGMDLWLAGKRKPILLGISVTGFAFVVLTSITLFLSSYSDSAAVRADFTVSTRNLVVPAGVFLAMVIMTIMKSVFSKKRYAAVLCGILLLFLIVADLYRVGWKFTPFVSATYFYPETQLTALLSEEAQPFRIMSVDRRIMPPNSGGFYGIETLEGYDSVYDPRYEKYMASAARNSPDIRPPYGFNRIFTSDTADSPLFGIANVRYVLSLSDGPVPGLTEYGKVGEVRVYTLDNFSPRVYLAGDVRFAGDEAAAISTMYDETFISGVSAVTEGVQVPVGEPLAEGETLAITGYSSDSISIESVTRASRLLVLTNAYHPNWRATIDGQTTGIIRTNYLFMGIVVPQGSHSVHITYSVL